MITEDTAEETEKDAAEDKNTATVDDKDTLDDVSITNVHGTFFKQSQKYTKFKRSCSRWIIPFI